nr:DUF2798 domain-containing protein [uncultured Duganella sp.]
MNPALRMRAMFALLMSLLMSSLMSGWVTWLNLGLSADFLPHWQHAFFAAWPAAFTIVMLCGPTVHRLASRMVA